MTTSVEKPLHTLAMFVFVAEAMFVIGLFVTVTFGGYWSQSGITTPLLVVTRSAQPVEVRPLPDILRIPAIGVNAKVQSVGLDPKVDNQMAVPSNFTDVGWYDLGPRPGMPGSAVIDGHYNGKQVPEAVFYDLDKLTPGDLVEVFDVEGGVMHFTVLRVETYDYNAATEEVFSHESTKPRLNLITCGGTWVKDKALYDKRTVVFTELID